MAKKMIVSSGMYDATSKFYPVNRKLPESQVIFRMLTGPKDAEPRKVQQNMIRIGELSDLEKYFEKYGNRFSLRKSPYAELPFVCHVKRNILF